MSANKQVRIENPVSGGNAVTSLKRANRFVRSGRAVFLAPLLLRFLDTPLNRVALEAAREKLLIQNTGYDRTDRSFFAAARHIPIVNAAKMIREERSPRNWSFTVSVFRQGVRPRAK
jgi:hypothetical protein